jgi:hypothetical protein
MNAAAQGHALTDGAPGIHRRLRRASAQPRAMDRIALAFEQTVNDVALPGTARASRAAAFAVGVEWMFTGAKNKALERQRFSQPP